MKDTGSAVEPANYTSDPGVCAHGEGDFPEAFFPRSLCPKTGFFECNSREGQAGASVMYAPGSMLPISKR